MPTAVIPPSVTVAESPAVPPQQPVATEATLDTTATAEFTGMPPVPVTQTLNVTAQSVEHTQNNSEVYAPTAQFSPAVEPQTYDSVNVDDFMGTRLPPMPTFWQPNELTPILVTDQEVMEQQDEVEDTQVPTPPTPQCHTALGDTDEEV